MSAGTAFAHTRGPQPGTHFRVAKPCPAANPTCLGDYTATHTTIQSAVNAATPGQVIEILDESVYEEQVTIDGRDTTTDRTRWTGVINGKNGITIKYVPPPGAAITARPTIKWQDTRNIGPTTCQQAKVPGDTLGSSGNFATNGALRIIRATSVKIEGLIIDGGGSFRFSNKPVWVPVNCNNPTGAQYTALQHGNAAVAVAISHNVQIRDCQLQNAYFGIAFKDRNTGGIFGNPNPSDNDQTIPLSGFGQTGNHLIEYNRVHDNDVGLFFESCWDLGSTIRYNLIYNNYHKTAVVGVGEGSDKSAAAIIFKDIYITPLAIYNNTFWNNAAHLLGMWQVGYQHLIFNNIFTPRRGTGGQEQNDNENGNTNSYMAIEHLFPNRMHNSVFAKDAGGNDNDVQFRRLGQLNNPTPGARLPGAQGQQANPTRPNPAIPSAANIHWLETPFQSTTETAATFLEPNWTGTGVNSYIKDYGWLDVGIIDPDGSRADLGAISNDPNAKRPCDGKAQTSRARVSPYGFVTINGTTAVAKITISQEVGALTGLTVKYLRWVTPVPDNTDTFGQEAEYIAAGSIRTVTAAAPADGWKVGANQANITVPQLNDAMNYGFFEVVFEGKDANGNTVTTDVGFLPYRRLEHELEIRVMNGTTVVNNPVVVAGEPVTIRVRAMKSGSPYTAAGGYPLNVAYSLSLPTSRIYQQVNPVPTRPLLEDNILTPPNTYTKTYTVYFTKAMESEVITGAGLWCNGDCDNANTTQRLPFPGDLVIRVRPGVPEKVVFQDPISNKQLGPVPPGVPATIVGTYPVVVQVQDKFDNPVDVRAQVTLRSLEPDTGGVEAPTAVYVDTAVGANRGNASFTATVENGSPGSIFRLEGSATFQTTAIKPDTGTLRVGRAADGLRVFYYQSTPPKHGSSAGDKGGYWEDDFYQVEEVSAIVGTRVPVWVKVRSNGDTIVTSKSTYVCVTPSNPGIQFSATEGGAAAAGPYLAPVTDGVASFWITSAVAVENASLSVEAKKTAGCEGDKDNSVSNVTRAGITFTKPTGDIGSAFVRGDGYARPTYVEITFNSDGTGGGFNTTPETWRKPDSVTLRWPGVCDEAPTARGTVTYLADGVTIGVTFPAGSGFPEGYSSPGSSSGALVVVYDAIEAGSGGTSPAELADSIGPLIAGPRDPYCSLPQYEGPTFVENKNRGVAPDTLRLRTTEPLADVTKLEGGSIFISRSEAGGPDEIALNVLSASFNNGIYTLVISPETPLTGGYWIKLNREAGMADDKGNRPLSDNRRVQISEDEAPAYITKAWYTINDATGKADAVYITFDKPLAAADIPVWFGGGSFSFTWDGGTGLYSIGADNAGEVVTLYTAALNTIRVDLGTNEGERDKMLGGRDRIRTSGTVSATVTFGTGKTGWKPITVNAEDKARPVLISAALQIGSYDDYTNTEGPDTLILTFSEHMRGNISNVADPVKILGGNCGALGEWRLVPVRADVSLPSNPAVGNGYHEVRYVVAESGIKTCNGNYDPVEGDLVRINHEAGVADVLDEPNVQNVQENRSVPLRILPGKPAWKTTVKNNPFRDSVVIETSPRARGNDITVEGHVWLYDNMGKLVWEEVRRNDPSRPDKAVEWVWKGVNKSGRTVGTGTYLFKAHYTAYDNTNRKSLDPWSVKRSIGFVRR
jgi:hypothetical protein